MALTLAGEWEGDGGPAGSRDFPESRLGRGGVGPLLLFQVPCSHFLNNERLWGDVTVSIFCSARTSGVEVTAEANGEGGMA